MFLWLHAPQLAIVVIVVTRDDAVRVPEQNACAVVCFVIDDYALANEGVTLILAERAQRATFAVVGPRFHFLVRKVTCLAP